MTSPYTSVSISGYNTAPPPDDGTEISANALRWQTHLDKIGGPLKTLAEAVNANVQAAFTSIYGQTTAETTAVVTPTNYQYLPNNVLRYGATGDGVTNDTAAIQSLLDFATGTVLFPEGTYMCDALTISGASDLHIIGYGAIIRFRNQGVNESLQIDGTSSNITIEGLTFRGDDVATVSPYQIGINIPDVASTVVDNIKVVNCRFENLTSGVVFLGETNGTLQDLHVRGCSFFEMAGTVGGTGYGVHIGGGNALNLCSVTDNFFENCHRHSIYYSRGGRGIISNNIIEDHRDGDGDSGGLSAIMIARGMHVVCSHNLIRGSEDTAIVCAPDEAPGISDTLENILITNNIFVDNEAEDIRIGGGDPANEGRVADVTVQGNKSFRTDATNFNNFIEVFNCLGCDIVGNSFNSPTTFASIFSSIRIAGGGESAGTSDYTENVNVSHNKFYQDGTNPRPIRLDDLAANSGATMIFEGNIFPGTGTGAQEFHIPGGTHSNTNISVLNQRHRGLTTGSLNRVASNGGSATIPNGLTSVVITHNLGITPQANQLTVTLVENPTNDPGNVWISGITASQFTINCRNDPGASNLTLGWRYHPHD